MEQRTAFIVAIQGVGTMTVVATTVHHARQIAYGEHMSQQPDLSKYKAKKRCL